MVAIWKIRLNIEWLMRLIAGKEIQVQDAVTWKKIVDIQVSDKKTLSEFQEFICILDDVIEEEYTHWQESCDCMSDPCEDNWQDCKCKHTYINAQKVYSIYFSNNK